MGRRKKYSDTIPVTDVTKTEEVKAAEEVVKTDKIDSKKVISELVGEQLLKATIDKADFDISNSVLLEVADNFSRKV